MGLIVVISLICTIFMLVSYFSYEAHGEDIKAIVYGIGGISSFIITLILGYFFIVS